MRYQTGEQFAADLREVQGLGVGSPVSAPAPLSASAQGAFEKTAQFAATVPAAQSRQSSAGADIQP